MTDDSALDDADRTWLNTIMPRGGIPVGFIAVILWIDENGEQRWKCYSPLDAPISTALGLFELGKLDMIARADSGLPLRYPDTNGDT